jgi:type VI protein secretion system component Hcp
MSLRNLTGRLTYANVASTLCLFVLLGGSAYAAASITGSDVANGSLTSADIKDRSLRARDFKRGALARGPKGDAGPAGPQGAPGSNGAPDVAAPPAKSPQPVGRLTLPGIPGDGPGATIAVRSLAWSNRLSGDPYAGGGNTATPIWGEMVMAKAPDRSSPRLWALTTTGQHLPSATLELLAPGAGAPYARYVLKDVTATRFTTQGSGAERRDQVGLSFNAAIAQNPALTFDPSAPLPSPTEPHSGRMTVDGIAGETDLILHAWRLTRAATPQVGPFVVSKAVDASSPALLSRFAAGQHIKSATIKLLEPGSDSAYTTYVLTNAVISSFAVAGDGHPLERIGFEAARIESTTPVAGGAPIRSCYDRVLNAAC